MGRPWLFRLHVRPARLRTHGTRLEKVAKRSLRPDRRRGPDFRYHLGFKCRPGGESYSAVIPHGPFYGALRSAYLTFRFSAVFTNYAAGLVQGGALVLSFATRPHTQESVSQLSGIIASSPCIRLTKPPASITRFLGGIARAILPNQNIPASVDSKVRRFLSRLVFREHPLTRTIQHLSHDPAVVKDNETDQLIRRSASLRAVDDMLSRVCRVFQMQFVC
jgi:hypothetical protein